MKIAAVFVVMSVVLAGCPSQAGMDKVMGRAVQGTPVTQEQRIDCDLIFPGPDSR